MRTTPDEKVSKMVSKKTQLVDLVAMLPRDANLYTLESSRSLDDFEENSYLRNFVSRRLGQKLTENNKMPQYARLAEEKKYLAFSEDVKDALFYLPKGTVVYDAIHEFVNKQMQDRGFIKLLLPYFFKRDDNDLEELTSKFGERVIGISNDKNTCLRYASDPVLFAYMRGKEIPCEYDPLKIYSPGDSFRNEQDGEINRFKRPRASFIEDYHIFTSDVKDTIRDAHKLNSSVMDVLCDEWFISCDIEEAFFKENQDYLHEMVDECGKSIIFNLMNRMPNYYTLQFQYIYNISDGTFTNFADLQLDNVNGRRFNIQIEDKGYATIVHGNTTGRMQKVFIPLFDQAVKMQKEGKKPSLPLCVSPIQIRIVPMDDTFIDYCTTVFEQYHDQGYRVDIDDRDLKLNEKIKYAEREWIPYTIIIGENEVDTGKIVLRIRNGSQSTTTIDQSIRELDVLHSYFPKVSQKVSPLVSKQLDLSFLS